MPPQILSSPFLNLKLIDTLLSRPTTPEQRVQLLSARLHLLTNPPIPSDQFTPGPSSAGAGASSAASGSVPGTDHQPEFSRQLGGGHFSEAASSSRPKPGGRGEGSSRVDSIAEFRTRLELARAHLEVQPPHWALAETEAGLVESMCRKLLKPRKMRGGRGDGEVDGGGDEQGGDANREEGARKAVSIGEEANEDGGGEGWMGQLRSLRMEALELLVRVDEGMGKQARADRWRATLEEIKAG
ncbi:hypothetical protein EHS25_010173 [Saitozyma podzolica]|uniref:Uncharacterized protein n=1 Tax=Saitozyma podzolica TaxID=1890683 RepID=A0A427YIU0_9TREE|nr:hypothetical protein EHS25_010173 [Saitozyma podzolica]